MGKGLLNGQFEVASEVIPLWQAYTPKYSAGKLLLWWEMS